MDRLPPPQIANRYSTLQHNGLFGYQYDESKGTLYVCYCSDDLSDNDIQQLKMVSGVESLQYGDWIGHSYLSIHWSEHVKITDLFNTMLLLGYSFTTINNAKVSFSPKNGDETFSDEIMESKMVSFISDHIKQHPQDVYQGVWVTHRHFKIWNYKTEQGKQLCHTLRRMRHKKPANWNSENNYLLWTIFHDEPIVAQPPVVGQHQEEPPSHLQQQDDDIDDGLCLICMANAPNTKVPCGCVVVCDVCSEQLKHTSDVHTCVKCRRPFQGEPILL